MAKYFIDPWQCNNYLYFQEFYNFNGTKVTLWQKASSKPSTLTPKSYFPPNKFVKEHKSKFSVYDRIASIKPKTPFKHAAAQKTTQPRRFIHTILLILLYMGRCGDDDYVFVRATPLATRGVSLSICMQKTTLALLLATKLFYVLRKPRWSA